MSYRDDLASAHERIGRLEADLAEARAPKPGPPPHRGRGPLLAITIASILLVIGGTATLLASRGPRPLDPIRVYRVAEQIPAGKHVRVRGDIVDGSVRRRTNPCGFDFSIGSGTAVLDVRSDQCVLPDTFARPGFWVLVEGERDADGHFQATSVLSLLKDVP